MSIDVPLIIAGFIFSGVGFVYLMYGKKQGNLHLAADGLVLMIYPYFVSSLPICIAIGILGSVLPFIMRWW